MSDSKDPVAAKSTFLCMYMSNHPDTLVAYVKYWGKIHEPVVSAEMSSIDTKGMTLAYKVRNGGDAKKQVRIAFDPPLAGYEEVKPRLLAMTADAQESLGMTKTPQISTFDFHPQSLSTVLPISFLIYTTVSPSYFGPFWSLGHMLYHGVGGYKTIVPIWIFAVTIHLLEALYVQRLCVKHRTPFDVGLKYVLATFFLGFPVLNPLRSRIQKARIDSIMKGN